ncbi:MAG: NAD(P)-dependent oxidoreductase [Ilumatobacter sp.]
MAVRWRDDLRDELIARLGADNVTTCNADDQNSIGRALPEADVAIVASALDGRYLSAPHLRWIHIDRAGIDQFAPPELFDGRVITTSAGRSAPAVADQAVLLLLAVSGDIGTIERMRRRRLWSNRPLQGLNAVTAKHAVVVGAGAIGSAIARRFAAMGITATGISRRTRTEPLPFDRVIASPTRRQLVTEIESADIVVVATGLNDRTHHIIDQTALNALGPTGIIVNVGRGALIDQRALARSLRSRRIAGAGLSVADPEPLPPWNPLWRTPNTVLIPHAVPRLSDRDERSLDIIDDVASAVKAGQPVARALTVADAYTRQRSTDRLTHHATKAWHRTAGRRMLHLR